VDFTTVDDATDTLTITDISKIFVLDVRNNPADPELTSDATGTVNIGNVDVNRIAAVQISVVGAIWSATSLTSIQVTGLPPSTVHALDITFAYGNMIKINQEYIGFTSAGVNPITTPPGSVGTISGLRRGLYGSIINQTIAAGTLVQSVLSRDALPAADIATWWYGPPADPAANTTLDVNTSPAALILQRIV
jgi:hypothetical protein